MTHTYTKRKLYDIAEENYLALAKFCSILEQEGYWEQSGAVLNMTILECLDRYVQAVLIQLAVTCKPADAEQRKFICQVTRFHAFKISEKEEISAAVCDESMKALQAPPIILQLCGLRDINKGSGIAGLFFDALLNIILAQAYLGSIVGSMVVRFITELYKRISAFLYNSATNESVIDEKYIFYKISNTDLENTGKGIHAAGDDFKVYKSDVLKMPDKERGSISRSRNRGFSDKAEEEQFRQYMKNKLRRNVPDKKTDTVAAYEEEDDFKQYIGNYEDYEDDLESDKKPECNEVLESNSSQDDSLEKPNDVEEAVKEIKQKTKLDELLAELNGLIGLAEVKKEIGSLINLIKVKKMRESHNLPVMDMSYHMVFTGKPGTGKTTIARLIAEIYKEIGLLSRGCLVETDRAGLVAGFVGQTAIKVTEVVEKAIGGVLFIDEAYSLSNSLGTNDFGAEAIDALVKLMEDNRDDLVIIAAGYTDEMEGFLKANTGLISRFNKFIEFPDYTVEELIKILNSMSAKAGFVIEDEAQGIITNYLLSRTADEMKAFGNARGIRNMFEKMVVNQADRIVECAEPTIELLTIIQKEDVSQWE